MNEFIAFDIDDTLGDCASAVLKGLNERLGVSYTKDQMTSIFWEEVIPGATFEMVVEILSAGIYRDLDVLPGAHEFVHAAVAKGYKVCAITARTGKAREDTMAWLRKNDLPIEDVYFVKDAEKATKALELGVTAFFEDRVKNANAIAEAGIDTVLINMPSNAGKEVRPNVVRIDSYTELL
jgi:HAD superfamily hydrolase (TIGR01509 family)